MSSIDKRIVELVFDNIKFEKNVEQSRGTLDKLKNDLKFEGASQGIESVSASIKRFSMGNIGEAIGTVTTKFSTLEIIGKRVLENLTDSAMRFGSNLISSIAEPITSGGWNRALKLEQANFQLRGLLGDTAEGAAKIEAIMDSVSKSVKGTAYGLDDAAKVASQLVATGIEDSEQMLKYLKGVAGAAAMTGGSYEDIGRIFTTVAGQGRLMGDQLLQFASRGVNVAATLSKQMGITEAEFRELVSKGEIDFRTFAEGMATAFGEHATKANETFTGSLSNMRAALARIGADVATPALTNLRDIFNALRPLIDNVHEALMPFINILNDGLTHATKEAVKYIGELSDKVEKFASRFKKDSKDTEEATESVTGTVTASAEEIEEMARRVIAGEFGNGEERRAQLEALGYSFEEVQNKVNELKGCSYRYEVQQKSLTESTKNQADETKNTAEQQERLNDLYRRNTIDSFFMSIKNLVSYFAQYATAAHNAFKEVFDGSLLKMIRDLSVRFKVFTAGLKLSGDQADGLKTVFKILFTLLKTGLGIVGFFVERFFNLVSIISNVKDRILEFVGSLDKTNKAFDETSRRAKFIEAIKTVYDKLIETFEVFKTKIKTTYEALKETAGLKHLHDSLTALWNLIKEVAGDVFDRFINKLNLFGEYKPDVSWVDSFAGWLEKAADSLANFIDLVISKKADFDSFINTIKSFFTGTSSDDVKNGFIAGLTHGLGEWDLKSAFVGLKDSIIKAIDGNIDDAMNDTNFFENVKGYFSKLGEILSLIDWGAILKHLSKIVIVFAVVKTLLSASSMFKSVSTFINGVSDKLKLKNNVVANFTNFSKAVLAIAAALFIIALIPPNNLTKALITLGVLSGVLIGIIGIFGLLGKKGKLDMSSANAMAKDFLQISASLLMLSLAVSKLGKMSLGEIAKGELAVAGLVTIMTVASKAIGKTKSAVTSFLLMAVAVNALIPPMLIFGHTSRDVLIQGGVTVLALVTSLALATRIAKSGVTGAASMLVMAAAVNALIPPMLIFGYTSKEVLIQGGITIVALIAALVTATKLAKSALSGAVSMVLMATSVVEAAVALLIVSTIPLDKMLTGALTLSAMMFALVICTKYAESAVRGAASMVLMALSVVEAAVALRIIASIPMDQMLAGALTLSAMMFALVTCTKYAESALRGALTMAVMSVPLLAAALGLRILAEAPIANMLVGALALSGVMIALAAAGHLAAGTQEGAVMMLALTVPLLGACYGLSMLAQYPWESLIAAAAALGIVFLSISAAIAILSLVPFPAGIAAIALMDLFIASLIAVVAIMGGLFGEGGPLEGVIHRAVPVMEDFGKAIGSFIGSIFETIGESVSATLERFGQAIGNFGDSIVPFIDAVKQVDETVLAGCLRLCEAVLAITATEFISNLTSFFGLGDSALVKFGKELVAFSVYFKKYSENVKGIGEDTVSGSAAAAEVLADMYKKVTDAGLSGGVIGWLEGKPLQKFGEELAAFGPNLKKYATVIEGVKPAAVGASASAGSILADMYKTVTDSGISGGVIGFLEGNPLKKFGEELKNFGPSIAQYSSDISGISATEVTASAMAASMLAQMYKTMSDAGISGGFVGWLEGNPLKKFGQELEKFGPLLKAYADSVSGLDATSLTSSASAAETLSQMVAALSSIGDYSVLENFGKSLDAYGKKLLEYSKKVSSVSFTNVSKSVDVTYSLIDMSVAMSSAPCQTIDTFGKTLSTYGTNFNKYYRQISGISFPAVDVAIATTYKLLEVGNEMAYVDTKAMSNFGNALENVGKTGVEAFINSFTNSYDQASSAAAGLLQAANNGLYSTSSYFTWWNFGIQCVQGFIDGLASGYQAAADTAANVGVSAMNGITAALGIASPSKEMYALGDYGIQGFVNAFLDGSKTVYKAGNDMADTALKAMTKPVEMIQRMLDTDLDLTPTITPVLDLSNIANGATTANGLLSGIGASSYLGSLNVGTIGTRTLDDMYQARQMDRLIDLISGLADEDRVINNTFNITGDNPREIAEKVSSILQFDVERKGAVWA